MEHIPRHTLMLDQGFGLLISEALDQLSSKISDCIFNEVQSPADHVEEEVWYAVAVALRDDLSRR